MTYEQLEKKIKASKVIYENDNPRDFRTLTFWHSKNGYRIAVRWSDNFDASSKYNPTIQEAYNEIVNQFPFNGWKLKI